MSNSDKFIKYSSIENHYQEGFLARCPQEDIIWCMTEKIHGSNFQIYFDGEHFLIGSRNRFLNTTDKFHNLQKLVEEIKPNIEELKKYISKPVTLYGEVYGDGIQKGVKYSKEPKIRFFDIKIGINYVPYSLAINMFQKFDLPFVPVLSTFYGNVNDAVATANTKFNSFIAEGEYAELDENLCEGIVIKPFGAEFKTAMGSRVIIKKKNEEFFEKKKMPKSKPDKFVDYLKDSEAIAPYINENRFDAVFSKEPYAKGNFGDFIKAYAQDVVEDAAKDSVEVKNPKNLNNIIAKTFKQEYFRRVA